MADNVVPLRPLKGSEESVIDVLRRLMTEFPNATRGIVIVFDEDRGMHMIYSCDTHHAAAAATRLGFLSGQDQD